ncbi:unnamed protein product, partial [Sphagnum tenellum]
DKKRRGRVRLLDAPHPARIHAIASVYPKSVRNKHSKQTITEIKEDTETSGVRPFIRIYYDNKHYSRTLYDLGANTSCLSEEAFAQAQKSQQRALLHEAVPHVAGRVQARQGQRQGLAPDRHHRAGSQP